MIVSAPSQLLRVTLIKHGLARLDERIVETKHRASWFLKLDEEVDGVVDFDDYLFGICFIQDSLTLCKGLDINEVFSLFSLDIHTWYQPT